MTAVNLHEETGLSALARGLVGSEILKVAAEIRKMEEPTQHTPIMMLTAYARSLLGDDEVLAETAEDQIGAIAALNHVVAVAALNVVVAAQVGNDVVAGTAAELVVAIAAIDIVVAAIAPQGVDAAVPVQSVIALGAAQHIVLAAQDPEVAAFIVAVAWYFGAVFWRLRSGTAGVKPLEDLNR